MKTSDYRIFALALALIPSLFSPGPTIAEPRPSALSSGMDYPSVVKAWGAPDERVEHESARNDLWIYSFGRVSFHEGRVTSWSLNKAPNLLAENSRPERPRASDNRSSPDGDPQLVEEILAEIMKEAPQQDDKGPVGTPPPPAISMPNQPPPIQ